MRHSLDNNEYLNKKEKTMREGKNQWIDKIDEDAAEIHEKNLKAITEEV